MIRTSLYAAVALTAFASVPAYADTRVVDVSAYDPMAPQNIPLPVTQTFGPGDYTVSVVGKAGGGLYDAWAPAVPAAGNWEDRYTISYDGTTNAVNPYNGQRFPTAADALAAFSTVLTTFTLTKTTDVTFSIPDYLWSDNSGGVSLGVSSGTPAAVPEPATMGLFAVGGAALLAMRRRKKAAGAAA